jgi:hypothetical protein
MLGGTGERDEVIEDLLLVLTWLFLAMFLEVAEALSSISMS